MGFGLNWRSDGKRTQEEHTTSVGDVVAGDYNGMKNLFLFGWVVCM